jgi:hypothetical protein
MRFNIFAVPSPGCAAPSEVPVTGNAPVIGWLTPARVRSDINPRV